MDKNLFYAVFTKSDRELMEFLYSYLIDNCFYKQKDMTYNQNYLFAKGDNPILLVSHVDTRFNNQPVKDDIYIDSNENKVYSSFGLGADDRAGIYAILKIIENQTTKPYILFTNYKECFSLGARHFCFDYRYDPCLKEEICFALELDKNNANESVFCNINNKNYEQFINNFGFKSTNGLPSDVTYLSNEFKFASANLSIGYYHQQTYWEYLQINDMYSSIFKVMNILDGNKTCHKYTIAHS